MNEYLLFRATCPRCLRMDGLATDGENVVHGDALIVPALDVDQRFLSCGSLPASMRVSSSSWAFFAGWRRRRRWLLNGFSLQGSIWWLQDQRLRSPTYRSSSSTFWRKHYLYGCSPARRSSAGSRGRFCSVRYVRNEIGSELVQLFLLWDQLLVYLLLDLKSSSAFR